MGRSNLWPQSFHSTFRRDSSTAPIESTSNPSSHSGPFKCPGSTIKLLTLYVPTCTTCIQSNTDGTRNILVSVATMNSSRPHCPRKADARDGRIDLGSVRRERCEQVTKPASGCCGFCRIGAGSSVPRGNRSIRRRKRRRRCGCEGQPGEEAGLAVDRSVGWGVFRTGGRGL